MLAVCSNGVLSMCGTEVLVWLRLLYKIEKHNIIKPPAFARTRA